MNLRCILDWHDPEPVADTELGTVCRRCGSRIWNPVKQKAEREEQHAMLEADRHARLAARRAGDPDWMLAKPESPASRPR